MKNFNSFYRENIHQYNSGRIDRDNEILDLFSTAKKYCNHKSVVEFGCGTGRYLMPFLKNNWEHLGIDRSPDALNLAKIENKLQHNLDKHLPNGLKKYGCVLLIHMLHHNNLETIKYIIQQAFSILKHSGIILIKTASLDDLKSRYINKYFEESLQVNIDRYPSIKAVREILIEVGFTEINIINKKFNLQRSKSEIFNSFKKKYNTTLELISLDDFNKGLKKFSNENKNNFEINIDNQCTYIIGMKK